MIAFEKGSGGATFRPDVFHVPEGDFEEEDRREWSAAGFLFIYEFERLAGTRALTRAIQRIRPASDVFGQYILDSFYLSAPEDMQHAIQELIAKYCRNGDENWFTGKSFDDQPNCSASVP